MIRSRFAVMVVGVFLIWLVFLRTIVTLILPAIILAVIWGWWEIRELRRAMRTPPEG